ncbi:AMP-binding protein [Amycolatopsis sp. NPDC051372]|uniref:AMP-binding protein n=1 Tax=Amycolatopsis sp. NPDC051372 TaxID=3155669 RepID=UPI003428AC47
MTGGDPFAVLSLPFGVRPDPDEFIQAAMRWHFGEDTGSRFWLSRAASLGFDPISDITTFPDLARFPNVTDELRDVPLEDLIPQGYGHRADVVSIVESGGTTGAPKSLPLVADFTVRMAEREAAALRSRGVGAGKGWLAVVPSGPHGGYEQSKRTARMFGSYVFGVDFDPRWVKKQITAGRTREADEYVDHILDQAAMILTRQRVNLLRTTPPLLARIARHDDLVQIIQKNVEYIHWGGASMDPDTRDFLRTAVFPGIAIVGAYGTTMALGSGGIERPGLSDDDPCIFDPGPNPHTSVRVVDPETGARVEFGGRGRIAIDFVTRGLFVPNNLERDEATRTPALDADQIGDSFADVAPVAEFGGTAVVEGVY